MTLGPWSDGVYVPAGEVIPPEAYVEPWSHPHTVYPLPEIVKPWSHPTQVRESAVSRSVSGVWRPVTAERVAVVLD